MFKPYNPSEVEARWQQKWADAKIYETDLQKAKKPYYSLVMFPYPSGDKLHVGHWYNYAPADSFARFQKMQGYDVFSPMGFDAFGLPAENYAIKTGVHPAISTAKNVETMIAQLKKIGCMYDWSKTLSTTDPEYYQWTQWLFLEMYKNTLAYKKKGNVNFCPSCQTVLANEQVKDGSCERCGTDVVQKSLEQWFWNITKYSQKLLDGLEDLDWPNKTKIMQQNWIGRSEGCDVSWNVENSDIVLDTFTTTVDTIYGVTFVVIAPDHPMLSKLVSDAERTTVEAYIKQTSKKSEFDRQFGDKVKTGVFSGTYLLHPFTKKKVPLWVADYVLMNYGTGVVMGVPAHDQRDMDFAKKYTLPIIQSIESTSHESLVYDNIDKYSVQGTIIDSGEYTGMKILEGRKKIIDDLQKRSIGKRKILYRLRDWLVSRQRYWGAPIPIVYDPEGKPHPVPEEHLPWTLPTDVEFKPTGKSPLTESKEFLARTENIFGKGWTPEYDTMDTFVCSSFYYLRYLMSVPPLPSGEGLGGREAGKLVDPALEKKWLPVSMYIGGPEHACMHLIYARFVMMALKDFGYVSNEEPFKIVVHQGLITNKGAKMSKSKGNVVSPDSFVAQYGSDVFRMYLMFMGPFEAGGDWSDTGIRGTVRFVDRLWKALLNTKVIQDSALFQAALHRTIKKVTEDIAVLHFNTAISSLMQLLNLLEEKGGCTQESARIISCLLAPIAPHLAEELWLGLGGTGFIIEQKWPTYDPALLVEENMTIVIQVNGKVRGDILVSKDASKEEILTLAKANENVKKWLAAGDMKKEIYILGKLVSLVV